uniref:Uncharacterized protein ycf20 n=1 Tax=Acrochaetium secundatum TaxID=209631 RepID=A0A4D6BKF0_9FLOR|nr:hypothetical protein [Acrochaetium secundatum]QBX88496.1 hypothetical protein [Acrochaetium secundatum]
MITKLYRFTIQIFDNKLVDLSLGILSILFGFFISNTLSTIPGQTGDWGIIGAAIIVTCYEITSKKMYTNGYFRKNNFMLLYINNIKVGVIYGFFVDAFKLGS